MDKAIFRICCKYGYKTLLEPENFAWGIKGKHLLTGWKQDYLLKVLAGLSYLGIKMRSPWRHRQWVILIEMSGSVVIRYILPFDNL